MACRLALFSRARWPRCRRGLRARAGAVACAALLCSALGPARASSAASQAGPSTLPPELATVEVRSPLGVVASADPQASRAGARILAAGGNAVDAAVATAFALGVVDPTCAGLGGHALALVRLADGREVMVDGSPTVPIAANPSELAKRERDGALFGHPVAATPTMLATMTHLLARYGTMSLARTLQPAIELAEGGHTLRPYVEADLNEELVKVKEDPYLTDVFLREGHMAWPAGCLLTQPVLAATMRRIAAEGETAFYVGGIAAEIEADMLAHGGYVRRADLAAVRVVERAPLRARYRDVEVVSVPAPGGGGAVLGALQILAAFPAELLRQDSADRLHILVEAVRIAFLDSMLSPVPSILDPAWARRRAAVIDFRRALPDEEIARRGAPAAPLAGGTSQVSVLDRHGCAVAMTVTLGDCAMAASPRLGFPYSSVLGGFDFTRPTSRNHLAPGHTVRTTVAPVLLLRGGTLLAALGSAGSARIPSSLVAVISNLVDRGSSLGEAVAAPRVVVDPPARTRVLLELAGSITAAQADELEARGFWNQFRLAFPPRPIDLCAFGGVNTVAVERDGMLVGVGDPRRQGGAAAPSRATQPAPPGP